MTTVIKNDNNIMNPSSIKVKVYYTLRGSTKSSRLTTFFIPTPINQEEEDNDTTTTTTVDLSCIPISLKTCLWSICSSSPDIICKDHDLSIYTANFHESSLSIINENQQQRDSLVWEGHGLLTWLMDHHHQSPNTSNVQVDDKQIYGKPSTLTSHCIDIYIDLQPTMKWNKVDYFSAIKNQSFQQFKVAGNQIPLHPMCNCYNNNNDPPLPLNNKETELDRFSLRHNRLPPTVTTASSSPSSSSSSPPLPTRLLIHNGSIHVPPPVLFRPEPIYSSSSSSSATTPINSNVNITTATTNHKQSRINSPPSYYNNNNSKDDLTLPIPSSSFMMISNNNSNNNNSNNRKSAFTIASISDSKYLPQPPPPPIPSSSLNHNNTVAPPPPSDSSSSNSGSSPPPPTNAATSNSTMMNDIPPVIYTPSNKKRKKDPPPIHMPSSMMIDNHSFNNNNNSNNNSMYHQPSTITTTSSSQQQQQQQVNTVVRTYYEVDKDSQGAYILPVEIDSWTVVDLGTVIYERPAYHNQRYIYPANYTVRKWYRSMVDPKSDTQYTCRILENGREPKFEVTADDCPMTYSGPTPTTVWTIIVRRAFAIRNQEYGHNPVGPDFFGLRKNTIAKMIQDLPNASKCSQYVWQTFEPARFNKPGRNRRRTDSSNNNLPASLLGGVNYGLTSSSRLVHHHTSSSAATTIQYNNTNRQLSPQQQQLQDQ